MAPAHSAHAALVHEPLPPLKLLPQAVFLLTFLAPPLAALAAQWPSPGRETQTAAVSALLHARVMNVVYACLHLHRLVRARTHRDLQAA